MWKTWFGKRVAIVSYTPGPTTSMRPNTSGSKARMCRTIRLVSFVATEKFSTFHESTVNRGMGRSSYGRCRARQDNRPIISPKV